MSDIPQELLRTTFEQVLELYDRVRPSYPPQIFDDLVGLARLPARARLVEIGCGTGQATLPLAERGYAITCIELGEQLGAVAWRKLVRFPSVEVINANFETWEPERSGFDAVLAFSAFHWVRPDLRYTKTADLLRDRGKLAFVSMAHVLPHDGDPFFIEVTRTRIIGRSPTSAASGCSIASTDGSRRVRSEGCGRRTWRCSTSPSASSLPPCRDRNLCSLNGGTALRRVRPMPDMTVGLRSCAGGAAG